MVEEAEYILAFATKKNLVVLSSYDSKSAVDKKLFVEQVVDLRVTGNKLAQFARAQPALRQQRVLLKEKLVNAHQKQQEERDDASHAFASLFGAAPNGWKPPKSYKHWVFDIAGYWYICKKIKAVIKGWPPGISVSNPSSMRKEMREKMVAMIANKEIMCEFSNVN